MTLRLAYIVDEWVVPSQTFIRNEVAELRRQGVSVELIALRAGNAPAAPDEAATILADAVAPTVVGRIRPMLRAPRTTLRLAATQGRLWPERVPYRSVLPGVGARLRDAGVHWVHAHFAWEAAAVAEVLAAIAGTGWSFTAHANDIFVANRFLDGRLRRADRLVTVCQYNLDELRERHRHLPPTEVVVCGVEPARAPAYADRRHDIDVLGVGRLVEKKGFDLLIEAAALLAPRRPSLRVEIVGDGPEATRLRSSVHRLGLHDSVRLPGERPNDEVLERMVRSKVVCLPARVASDGDRDSMPVVLKEAMSRGVPVVGTAVAAIPEMVDAEVGRLVPPDDVAALADALDELLTDASLAARLGATGRRRVAERFTLSSEVARLRGHFEQWVAERPPLAR